MTLCGYAFATQRKLTNQIITVRRIYRYGVVSKEPTIANY